MAARDGQAGDYPRTVTIVQALMSFALVAGLLTIIPGLDTALVLRGAITRTRGYAFATALGVCTGALLWGIAAAVGASALLAASDVAYRVLTLAGAGYMVWLGASMVWKSFRRRESHELPAAMGSGAETWLRGWLRGWLLGVGTNLLNPKVGVFYIATIPLFIPSGTSPLLMGVLLATVHATLSILWFTAIIIGTGFAGRWLKNERATRIVDRITGVVLIGFGGKLVLQPR